jgi:hypothetical protein
LDGAILTYKATAISLNLMIAWSQDVLEQIAKWPKDLPCLLLYDLSHHGVSMPYLVLTNRDMYNIGFTELGRKRLNQIFESHPDFKVRLAVVLSSSASGELARKYSHDDQGQFIEYKPFVEYETAVNWLLSEDNEPLPQVKTHRIEDEMVAGFALKLEEPTRTRKLTNHKEVMLFINGAVEKLELDPDLSTVVGRSTVDLSPHGGNGQSVSRRHIRLHLENDYLFVTDLESTNGTFVNGTKLEPYKPVMLHTNDTLRLGELNVQVVFR